MSVPINGTSPSDAMFKDLPDVCQRCRYRYAGIKDSRQYDQKNLKPVLISSNADDVCPAKKMKLEVSRCPACLGVLQEEFMAQELEKVCEAILNSSYDADHFTLALSLPVATTLRNHAIALYLTSKDDTFDSDDVVPIKQIWKWVFSKRVQDKVGKRNANGDWGQFFVELNVEFEQEAEELECLQKMCEAEYRKRSQQKNVFHMGLITRQGVEKSLKSVSHKKFAQHYPVPPKAVTSAFTSNVTMYHNSIYVAGRYCKYSRELPQTPWIIDGVKKIETSVEEIIADHFSSVFSYDQAKFSTSGREDVDVRMLGNGRPFLFELTNPKKTSVPQADLDGLASRINRSKDVTVSQLQIVSKNEIGLLKDGEDQKTKTYEALCTFEDYQIEVQNLRSKIMELGIVTISQKTPIRVLHRRPNLERKRTVEFLGVEEVAKDRQCFKLRIRTQAGTYVKEFVHGDFGRTIPNLRTLLHHDIDIIALDVESIDLDWPKTLNAK